MTSSATGCHHLVRQPGTGFGRCSARSAGVASDFPKMVPASAVSLHWGRWLGGERRLGLTGRGRDRKLFSAGRGSSARHSPGNVESWQHVGGAGSRVSAAGGERASPAERGTTAAGEDGLRGTPAWGRVSR